MEITTSRIKVLIWIPAAFCALLSLMKMFSPNDAGAPAFYSFLPMCFFFAATVHLELLERIKTLEKALGDDLGQKVKTTDT